MGGFLVVNLTDLIHFWSTVDTATPAEDQWCCNFLLATIYSKQCADRWDFPSDKMESSDKRHSHFCNMFIFDWGKKASCLVEFREYVHLVRLTLGTFKLFWNHLLLCFSRYLLLFLFVTSSPPLPFPSVFLSPPSVNHLPLSLTSMPPFLPVYPLYT